MSDVPDDRLSDILVEVFLMEARAAIANNFQTFHSYSHTEILDFELLSQEVVESERRQLFELGKDKDETKLPLLRWRQTQLKFSTLLMSTKVTAITRLRYNSLISSVTVDALNGGTFIEALRPKDFYFQRISIEASMDHPESISKINPMEGKSQQITNEENIKKNARPFFLVPVIVAAAVVAFGLVVFFVYKRKFSAKRVPVNDPSKQHKHDRRSKSKERKKGKQDRGRRYTKEETNEIPQSRSQSMTKTKEGYNGRNEKGRRRDRSKSLTKVNQVKSKVQDHDRKRHKNNDLNRNRSRSRNRVRERSKLQSIGKKYINPGNRSKSASRKDLKLHDQKKRRNITMERSRSKPRGSSESRYRSKSRGRSESKNRSRSRHRSKSRPVSRSAQYVDNDFQRSRSRDKKLLKSQEQTRNVNNKRNSRRPKKKIRISRRKD